MDRFQSLGEVLSMLRRRALLWVSVIAFGVLISLVYVLSLPREYETSATIQIEQPTIQTGESSRGSLNAEMLQKLQIVEQRVMARDNLLAIIEKFGLYRNAGLSDLQKVDLLRRAARVQHITNPQLRWRQDISPSALLVTVRMTDAALAANVANELVNNVLDQEEASRSARVRETLDFFDSEERRISAAIFTLEAEIAEFKRENAVILPGSVESLRTRLTDLQEIELEVQRQILSLQDGGQAEASTIRGQRVARLAEERALYQLEISGLEAQLAATPAIEQAFSKLQRQLGKLEDQYEAVTIGKAQAEMNQMLEANRKSDSFAVLEVALPPDWPIAPSRKKILATGGMLSAAMALTLVFLAEMRSPVIWTRGQLERQLRLRAVAAIPVIETRRSRRNRRILSLAKIGTVLAAATALAGIALKFGR
ncbi:Chain length determinant protein [Shimia sp. SK013]|uniref:Wzz/FepE/Etk N-terminal domain-containing protein n=1 Tax=Shimia sp. SK013 TaxID=1389006 RepID=UPI0006B492E5|nr:Wzz/FepE/Etk N-terminal domain-containing protein [Shimia sp. SK013]KPA21239.1 Chain length determinant protein [Shimia sp. SK013]